MHRLVHCSRPVLVLVPVLVPGAGRGSGVYFDACTEPGSPSQGPRVSDSAADLRPGQAPAERRSALQQPNERQAWAGLLLQLKPLSLISVSD